MKFFIDHIGWFVGAFFIALFAIVGYFADKKEQKSNPKRVDNKVDNASNNDVSDIYAIDASQTSVSTSNDVSSSELNSVNDSNISDDSSVQSLVSNENNISSYVSDVNSVEDFYDGLDTANSEKSDNVDFNISVDGTNSFSSFDSDLEWKGSDNSNSVSLNESSFESIDMTLDDLEKGGTDIINDSLGVTNFGDGFVSDYNDDDLDFYENFDSVVKNDDFNVGLSESISSDSSQEVDNDSTITVDSNNDLNDDEVNSLNNPFEFSVFSNDNNVQNNLNTDSANNSVQDNLSTDSISNSVSASNSDSSESDFDDIWSL